MSCEGLIHTFFTSALSSSRQHGFCNDGSHLFSAKQFTEDFSSIVILNGGDGGIFSLVTPFPHHSHSHLPQFLA